MITRNLSAWLDYIAQVHPREIELGLDRARAVATRMQLTRPAPIVITVAGTNGKGSCVASLEALLQVSGYRTAAYTSPHIHVFNERVRINAENVADAQLCGAFAFIEASRSGVSLSYFEFATLAALWLFQQAQVEVAILEVGLGGRLDAVNLVDADVAIITSISLDHQDWLGDTVESIGAEKAGIMRAARPVLYAAPNPPQSIIDRARELGAPLLLLGEEFGYRERTGTDTTPEIKTTSWDWYGHKPDGAPVEMIGLPTPELALANVSVAMQALYLLPLRLSRAILAPAIGDLALAGRCELRVDKSSGRRVLFDVAHNPAAAGLLAKNVQRLREQHPQLGRFLAVMAVLADKDLEGMVSALESCVDIWYIAQVEASRCLSADTTMQRIKAMGLSLQILGFDSVERAYRSACEQATVEDWILVTGSFYTVAAVRGMSQSAASATEAPKF